jgi:hypothetical protein
MSLSTKLYCVIVFVLFSSLLNSCGLSKKWETTNAVILDVREPVKDSVLQMVVYGYFAGIYGVVDSTRIDYEANTVAGDCIVIKYLTKEIWKSEVQGVPFDCTASDYVIVYGNMDNIKDDYPVYIQRTTTADTSFSVFITDDYFQLIPMEERVDVLFEADGKRSKLLKFDLGIGSMPEHYILDLAPKFVDGSGLDTAHAHYNDIEDTWYFVPRGR